MQKTTLGWRQSAEKPEHLRRSLRTSGSSRLAQEGTPPGRRARKTTGHRTRRSGTPRPDWAFAFPRLLPPVLSPTMLPIGPTTARPTRTGGRARRRLSPGWLWPAPCASHWPERPRVRPRRTGRGLVGCFLPSGSTQKSGAGCCCGGGRTANSQVGGAVRGYWAGKARPRLLALILHVERTVGPQTRSQPASLVLRSRVRRWQRGSWRRGLWYLLAEMLAGIRTWWVSLSNDRTTRLWGLA